MSDTGKFVHLYSNQTREESEVWCVGDEYSWSAHGEATYDVNKVTCVSCLLAVEQIGALCSDRRHDLAAEYAARVMLGESP